jgi:hypothetical protein
MMAASLLSSTLIAQSPFYGIQFGVQPMPHPERNGFGSGRTGVNVRSLTKRFDRLSFWESR